MHVNGCENLRGNPGVYGLAVNETENMRDKRC